MFIENIFFGDYIIYIVYKLMWWEMMEGNLFEIICLYFNEIKI